MGRCARRAFLRRGSALPSRILGPALEAGDFSRRQIGSGFQADGLRIPLAGNGRKDIDVVSLLFPAVDGRTGVPRVPHVVVRRQMAMDRRPAVVVVRMKVDERRDCQSPQQHADRTTGNEGSHCRGLSDARRGMSNEGARCGAERSNSCRVWSHSTIIFGPAPTTVSPAVAPSKSRFQLRISIDLTGIQRPLCRRAWIDGHGTDPNEQNTQQSPAFRRSSTSQPSQV